MKKLILLLILIPNLAWGTIYYIDPTCGTPGDGTSNICAGGATDPFDQWSDVAWGSGNAYLQKAGTTAREQITVGASGADASHIIILGSYGSGTNPIVSGFDVTTGWSQYSSGTGAGNLVSDNFDDGDLTGWTTSGTPEASTDQAYSGTYSCKINAQEYIYQTFAASSEIWVQARVYASENPAAVKVIFFAKDGATNLGSVAILSTGKVQYWNEHDGASSVVSTNAINLGEWNLIEFYHKRDALAGTATIWLNGYQDGPHADMDTGDTDPDRVWIGETNAAGWTVYFDDIKISNDAYIGYGLTNYWYKAHTASDGGIVLEDGSPMKFAAWSVDPPTSFATNTAPSATFDGTGNRVYVWCTANADPATKTMEVSVRDHAIAIDAKDYITIENITFQGAYTHGGHQTGGSDYVTWTDCVFKYSGGQWNGATYLGNGFEVNGGSTNLTMTGCSFYQNFDIGLSVQMLTGNGNLSAVVIDGATCYQNRASGIEILMGSGNGTMSDITVKNSTLRNNDGTGWSGTHANESGIYVDSYIAADMSNVSLQYNLIYANGIRGIYTLKNSTGAVPVTAYNNVIYNNGIGVVNTATLTIKNNITSENTNGEINTNTDITSDYNEIYHSAGGSFITYDSSTHTFAQWQAHGFDAHGLSSDPLFVSTATPDFSLQVTSPCINKGINVGLTQDYTGAVIPRGAGYDMGAYEYLLGSGAQRQIIGGFNIY